MTRWKQSVLNLLREIIRFAFWFCLASCGLMAGIFATVFAASFLWYLRTLCSHALFRDELSNGEPATATVSPLEFRDHRVR